MDLIFTNAERSDLGVLATHSFDLSYGASENDFELTIGANEPMLETNACVYIEGTEYGGMVGGMKTSTHGETITYKGRTWHGVLNSKVVQPDTGEDYFVVSGDANEVLALLIDRLGLSDLFTAEESTSGVNISSYKFHRYCRGYDGVMDMLSDNGGKLKIAWTSGAVHLSAEPIVDYTESPIDGDIATLTVEQSKDKVNHLICLGQGDLAAREVVHLYVDQNGEIGTEPYYTGVAEIVETYENTNSDDLTADGIAKLKELQNVDKADVTVPETLGFAFDIGDIVGATDVKTGIKVTETVTQKIIKIINGTVSVDYKTGGTVVSKSQSTSGSGTGGGGSDTGNTASVTAVKSVQRYWLLQDSTIAAPDAPTEYPPPDSWEDTEPEYTEGSGNSLYTVVCTVFTDDTFSYSEVSKSCAYDAANTAYDKAVEAYDKAAATADVTIVESGTKSGYSYRKWSDGTKECWCVATTTKNITNGTGIDGIVASTASVYGVYPSGMFTSPPACKMELLGITSGTTAYNGWFYTYAAGTAERTPQMRVARMGTAISSVTVTFSVYAIGV